MALFQLKKLTLWPLSGVLVLYFAPENCTGEFFEISVSSCPFFRVCCNNNCEWISIKHIAIINTIIMLIIINMINMIVIMMIVIIIILLF